MISSFACNLPTTLPENPVEDMACPAQHPGITQFSNIFYIHKTKYTKKWLNVQIKNTEAVQHF